MCREWSLIAAAFVLGGLAGALAVAGLNTGPAVLPGESPVAAPAAAQAPGVRDEPVPAAALGAGPRVEPEAEPAKPLTPDPVQARLDEVSAGWARMEDEVTRLRRRVGELEQRLAAVPAKPAETSALPRASSTPDGQRGALVKAGLAEGDAAELVRRQGQQALDRLNLRDLAVREGWLGTDRYREEAARLDEAKVELRSELGEEVYDRYLYAAGDDNRVRVDGIIPGSVAELAGLQPGDLIETYAGARVFNYSDLRDATAAGERGELVQVQVRRGQQVFDAWLARGPLGVQLDSARAAPR
jgi:hypothetical protein